MKQIDVIDAVAKNAALAILEGRKNDANKLSIDLLLLIIKQSGKQCQKLSN